MQLSPVEYVRLGQTPFFRLPFADLERGGADADRGAHAVILGVPYDGGTTYHPGARFAPYHVRRVSALLGPVHPLGRSLLDRLRVLDGGNVVSTPFAAPAVRELVQLEIG